MRALFVVPPGYGHLFPLVTTAWALRAAGHDVLVATCGQSCSAVAGAGLIAFDVAPDADLASVFRTAAGAFRASAPGGGGYGGGHPLFCRIAEIMADGTVAIAETWRPDLIVQDPFAAPALIAAQRLGVPTVAHHFGMGIPIERVREMIYLPLTDLFTRFNASASAEWNASIDFIPPSMRRAPVAADTWATRYVPFNGGGQLPPWAQARNAENQPRVLVTLGTVVPHLAGMSPIAWVTDAARTVDAEFVLATGDADVSSLGDLPRNVRPAGWVPLNALLPTCDAIIHHGGSGSTFTALAMAVPQLVVPQGADQFFNAEAVRARGVGLVPSEADRTPETVSALLSDESLRANARDVRNEIAAMPSPCSLVAEMERLARPA
jgi:UDP:flavonoid glycosyltransferase YjiC (YdhE family)